MATACPAFMLCMIVISLQSFANAGVTSRYVRKLEADADLPLDSKYFIVPSGHNAPQQVHLTQGDNDGQSVIVSWITPYVAESKVYYGLLKGHYKHVATGRVTTYEYHNYTSGFIHHCTLGNLKYETKYYYKLGSGDFAREFWFITPPIVDPDAAYTFGIIGDLGQTLSSAKTLQHYLGSNGQAVLYVGDLSYADNYLYDDNRRWDTWGRLLEPSTAYQSWIWTAGNHEIEFKPEYGETTEFKPFLHRFPTPYRSSGSTSPLWYSINRASAHVIVLSSYSAYGKYTPQYNWLKNDLKSVDRKRTPWLIILLHCPWYNSINDHIMEGETMRVQFEVWFVQYKVDIVFAGHVHAYERSHRVSNIAYNVVNGRCTPMLDESAPIYITVGDGGNVEGLSKDFAEPQPAHSAFREASYGHAILDIKNRTHAHYYWHRNQDEHTILSDSYCLSNQYFKP